MYSLENVHSKCYSVWLKHLRNNFQFKLVVYCLRWFNVVSILLGKMFLNVKDILGEWNLINTSLNESNFQHLPHHSLDYHKKNTLILICVVFFTIILVNVSFRLLLNFILFLLFFLLAWFFTLLFPPCL